MTVETLQQRIHKAASAVRFIAKTGWNDHFKYAFVSEVDVKRCVGDALRDAGLVVVDTQFDVLSSEVYQKGTGDKAKPYHRVTVRVGIDIMSADYDEGDCCSPTMTLEGLGTGVDGEDKAVYKAMAGAVKYALTTGFLIATGDDPEASTEDGKSTSGLPADFDGLLAAVPALVADGRGDDVKLASAKFADHARFGELKGAFKAAMAAKD